MDKLLEYKDIWILAQQKEGRLERISFELITRGRELADQRGCRLCAMLFGGDITDDELHRLGRCGLDLAAVCRDERLKDFNVEPYARVMDVVISKYRPEVIIAGATSTGRTLMPYAAIKANTGLTADCTGLAIDPESGGLHQTRPAIGGNIMATIKTPAHRPQMATVRPHSTKPAQPAQKSKMLIEDILPEDQWFTTGVEYLGFESSGDQVSLADSDRVVVVGRGIKKADNLPMIYELADALDAAVGATRDVVDRGWLSYPHQIGLSGITISPKLYIGIGVSGAIQHLAGMQTAETIIAINSDPEAQIFKIADFGIVGDLFEVVPALTQQIRSGGVVD
ncbi:Electron transfer flavoprotein large subunit [Limihaloglobus sulfuriphilus]|uniref:Electron transfer flavoprotein large subunit n=1 Tax=Limihaloglobus sulfuriphilus TaxID=1851148 RepID=A0A1Q2MDR8_9BACT|nr:electron transfer flavoprotein subunit alpha/FixB family protein [Limihaloglobus sulfuriphilus]AQQ70678.1 Electron transfer flavoprotein large subunit [Limihaloglobus sulfuriphilus]